MNNSAFYRFAIIGTLLLSLSSCGQKGPLVLPQPETAEPSAEDPPPARPNHQH